MHCCRLSHPSVYKVGKMSSTLNVHGGGMQRWCSSNNIWMQDEYVYIFDIFWYQLFFLTTLSHHWICRHIFLVPSCQCYWNSGKTHLQKWEGKRMEGCQDAYLYFSSDCENASGTLAPCNLTVAYQHKHQEFGLCGVIWPEILRKEKLWSGHLPEKENSPCLLYKRKLEDKEMHIFSIAKRGAVQLNTLQIHRICTHMQPQTSTQPQSGVTLWETECR